MTDLSNNIKYLSIQNILDVVEKINNEITPNFDIIDVEHINENKSIINNYYETLLDLTLKIKQIKDEVDNRIKTRISAIHNSISKLSDKTWTEVKQNKKRSLKELNVKQIDNLDNIQYADLYWVNNTNQYAIGVKTKDIKVVLTGNIGKIILKSDNPEKVKSCKHGSKCKDMINCKFWHDPNKIPGSKDIRNFMQNSWMYYGGNPELLQLPICHSGDSRYIESEASMVNEEEIDRREYQLMHDLLNIFMFDDIKLEKINNEKLNSKC